MAVDSVTGPFVVPDEVDAGLELETSVDAVSGPDSTPEEPELCAVSVDKVVVTGCGVLVSPAWVSLELPVVSCVASELETTAEDLGLEADPLEPEAGDDTDTLELGMLSEVVGLSGDSDWVEVTTDEV